MKTYIVNSLNDALQLNKKLDSMALLQNKEWTVFTDEANVKEKFLFMKKGKLLNSINGVSSYYSWQYIPINNSLIIENELSTLLFKIAVCDENILILNLDGTDEFCFLTNTTSGESKLLSYEDIQWYLIRKCNIDILTDTQRIQFEDEKRKREEQHKLEMEKQQKEEEEFDKIILYVLIGTIAFGIFLYFVAKLH